MQKGLLKDLVIIVLIGGALFFGGYLIVRNTNLSEDRFANEVSYEQEEKLGNLFKDLVWRQFEISQDNLADSSLQIIARRLLSPLDSTQYRYQFTLIKNEQINAFTIPGGNIFVFTGLIKLTETPEELAAVLAHEIGHTEKRHVVSKLVKALTVSAILSILSGNDPSLAAQVLGSIIGNSFDRDQEKDADQFALQLLENSSISPKSLARFFEQLNKHDLDFDKNLEIMMTHPHNDSRIEEARKYKVKNDFVQTAIQVDWEKVKQSLE